MLRVGSATFLLLATGLLASCGSSQASPTKIASDALTAGLAAQAQGKIQEATDDYNKCISNDPKNKYCYYDLGYINQTAGHNDVAERYYRDTLALDPEFVRALFNLAILRTAPSPAEAESLYRHVISIAPTNASAHLNLGFLLRGVGRIAEGNAELLRAVALDPSVESRLPPGVTVSPAPSPSPSR